METSDYLDDSAETGSDRAEAVHLEHSGDEPEVKSQFQVEERMSNQNEPSELPIKKELLDKRFDDYNSQKLN